ncbi:MAG TPA: 2-oxo acid dehydrogenase subunit E2 [Caulobacteraceae bacterium]|nr:2-oxo acid dehydrogenase subunit E2 [Caulobacteraceae bacterium]
MSEHPLIMPKLGQTMEFGTVAEWLTEDGAAVQIGQPVVSVESDKATYEIEATQAGVIRRLAPEGAEIPVGEPIATISSGVGQAAAVPSGLETRAPSPTPGWADRRPARSFSDAGARPLASPRAKALAQSLNVDIGAVSAHRKDRLIVAADVEAAASARRVSGADGAPATGDTPLTPTQRTAAERLARSWRQAPHIVQMVEVDAEQLATAAAALRDGRAAGTLNDLLIKAAADCLAQFPRLNARFGGDHLIPLPEVGVGLAVAAETGLTVPVVRGADRLSVAQIGEETRTLIAAARAGRLRAGQLGGASLTISNLGAYGIAFGTPVLNLDEPILVFVGALEERPVVQAGRIVVGRRVMLSIAYDHRVVDGLQAARFSQALKKRLETAAELLGGAADIAPPRLGARELEAMSPAGGLEVRVRDARHAWSVDEPSIAGGTDTGPDPVNLVLGALASCMVIALKLAARRRRIDLGEVRAHVAANPQGKVKEAALRIEVWSPAPEAEVRSLLAPAKAACLVHDMLRPDLPVAVELIVHPAEARA